MVDYKVPSCYEAFVLMCCVRFLARRSLCVMAKHLDSDLVCSKDIVPEVLWFLSDTTLQT